MIRYVVNIYNEKETGRGHGTFAYGVDALGGKSIETLKGGSIAVGYGNSPEECATLAIEAIRKSLRRERREAILFPHSPSKIGQA